MPTIDNNFNQSTVRYQTLFILDKRISTTITSMPEHAHAWIREVEFDNEFNPLRLIVGLDIKLSALTPSRVALFTLFANRRCLIFKIAYAKKIPLSLSGFLSDQNNTFVGVGLQSKLMQMQQEFGFGGGARYVDLGNLTARRYDRPELNEAGLSQLRVFLHGRDVERPKVVGNWDQEELSNEHVRHACIDAYTCYELGSFLVYPTRREMQIRNGC